MTFEECKKVLQKFDNKCLYGIKVTFYEAETIALQQINKTPFIFRINKDKPLIRYSADNGSWFRKNIQYSHLSKIQFTKIILKLIREYTDGL